MPASMRLAVLLLIGLFFLYAGLFNPMMMVGTSDQGGLYRSYGVGGVRAGELVLGLALTLGSGWLPRRELRRARERRGLNG